MFPSDDYTPHGYLDTPTHNWALHPIGVLRSLAPLGMGWHVPNYGSYGRNQFRYSAHLLAGLRVGERVLLTPQDFIRHGVTISSDHHSSQIIQVGFHLDHPALRCRAAFFLVDEETLACEWSLENQGTASLRAEALFALRYVYNPATTRRWVQGILAAPWMERKQGGALAGVYPEEDQAVALALAKPPDGYQAAPTLAALRAWFGGTPDDEPVAELPTPGAPEGCWTHWVGLRSSLEVPPGGRVSLLALLQRAVAIEAARDLARQALKRSPDVLSWKRAGDDVRWGQTPRLEGDWPAHWRRGWVYDLETLRMVARPKQGIFRRVWDGMQIQAPRLVLAEAALDALALSYADPALAQEVLLSAFTSAPLPNVPCMREDGSYNMLTETGEPCGTAPEWGFPLFCCDLLYRRLGDLAWLRKVYPGAAAYLRWWLSERRNAEGWLVYACSYESGQDSSPRFGPGDTGASSTRHLRPVDLQAAAAQAARILGEWAEALKLASEASEWQKIAQEYTSRTQAMWEPDGWFRDFDRRAGTWSPVRDAMHLAPLLCGCATPGQSAALAPVFQQPGALPLHGERWNPLVWPPVAFTVIESAAAVGQYEAAARLTMQVLEQAHRRSDSRVVGSQGGLPGIAREYWPDWGEATDAGPGGIEGYGWGALGGALLVRHILGLREVAPGRFSLAPAIPAALAGPGQRLRVGPLPLADAGWLRLEVAPVSESQICDIVLYRGSDVSFPASSAPFLAVEDMAGAPVALTDVSGPNTSERGWRFQLPMFTPVLLSLRDA